MAYHSGQRWSSLRCASAASSNGSTGGGALSGASTRPSSLSHSASLPSLSTLRVRQAFAPISPATSPMHTPLRGSPLSVASTASSGPSLTIRKPRPARPDATAARTRALAVATRHSMDGAAGEDARRPFCSNPLLGFQLDSPSRVPMTPPAIASSSMAPVPLSKSMSAPAGFGINFQNPLEPEAITQTPWKCKGCPSTNQDDLEPNADSAYTCIHCGTVDQQQCVSLARQGMCAAEDDGTWTGEARSRDAAQEAGEAVVRGIETNDERRRRLLAGNGTRIAKSTGKRHALGGAAGRLETQTCLSMTERADEDAAQTQKRHRIVEYLERDFDVLGKTLIEPVRKHVRMETKRILMNSAVHAKACTAHSCSLNLFKRPNYHIANCLMQECLERLKNDAHRVAIGASEYTTHTINEHLERMRELQEQGPSTGQVVQVTAAVRLMLDWSQERLQRSCGVVEAPPPPVAVPVPSSPLASLPPLLALPPAALSTTDALDSPHSSGSATSQHDANDIVYAVRDAVTGASIRANVRADVRCAAMAAIAQQELGDYIRTRNVLPIDVLGVAVLASVTSKLGLEDGTSELLAQCCHEHSISPTTAQTAIETMGAVMTVEPAAASGVFGDGIF